jgi:ABC-2 type transport system ATP-binding protein
MDSQAVAVRHLSIMRGGSKILRHLSFEVTSGTILGLIGPSGSGKTTLIRTIVGLQRITEGAVDIMGLGAGSAALRDRVGYMAQSPSVYDDLTVHQNILYFARILGYPRSEADRVIREVDLLPQRRQMVETLSGGQRARVSLAIALLGRPALLVLDEPTVGLDPVLRESLWGLFRRLSDDGVTLIVSSHVMEEAARCDRLLLIRSGKILANNTVHEILKQTGTRDVESAFLELVGEGRANV